MKSRTLMRTGGLLLSLIPLLVVGSCGSKDDITLGPSVDMTEAEEVFAWLWAYDATEDSLRVYDAESGFLHATFFAQPHPTLHEVQAGPAAEPTVWMGSGGMGFGFSAGFGNHGDHAHMELPTSLGTVATGVGNTHLTGGLHGQTVAWANDVDQTFTLVDTESMVPTTVDHGSPHSASLVVDGLLLATHMNAKWARLIDVETNMVLAEVTIDTLAHGEAFYHDAKQAFIPCLNGFDIIGFEEKLRLGSVAYPDEGRVNFLFHGQDAARALAPVREADGSASEVWILDMAQQTVGDIHLEGAALAWNRSAGQISVSGDGSTGVMSDLEKARVYVVDIDAGTAQTLMVEEAGMPCATDFAGEHIWLLDPHSGEIHFRHVHEGEWEEENGFSVHAGSDWIFVTSLDPAVELIRDY